MLFSIKYCTGSREQTDALLIRYISHSHLIIYLLVSRNSATHSIYALALALEDGLSMPSNAHLFFRSVGGPMT